MGSSDILVRLLLNSGQFEEGMDGAEQKAKKAAKVIEDGWDSANKAANIAGAAVLGAGGAAIWAATDFETAFVGVEQAVNGSDEQLKDLSNTLLTLSNSVPQSAGELADIAATLGDLGVHVQDIGALTKSMAAFASATGMVGKDGTQALGDLAKAMGRPVTDAGALASSIVGLGNEFQVSETKVLSMAEALAPTATALGMTSDATLGMSAALVKAGVDSETGGRAVSQALSVMNAAVLEGGDKLQQFATISGLSADQFKQKFQTDAAGALRVFLDGVANVPPIAGGAAGALDSVGLGGERVRNALLLAASAGNDFAAGAAAAAAAGATQAALMRESAIANESAGKQMQVLQNQVQTLAIDIGNVLLPVVMTFVNDYLKPGIGWLRDHQGLVLGVGGAILALAAAVKIANVAYGIYKLVVATSAAYTAIQEGATWGAVAAQWGLNAALLANPITWIVLAVVALIGIIWALVENWDSVVGAFGVIWDLLKAYFQIGWDILKVIIDLIVGAFKWVGDVLSAVWGSVGPFLTGVWNTLLDVAQAVFGAIVKIYIDPLVWAAQVLMDAWSAVASFFVTVWDGILAAFDAVRGFFLAIVQWMMDKLVKPLMDVFQKLGDFFASIWKGIKDVVQSVCDVIMGVVSGIVDAIKGFINLIIGMMNFLPKSVNFVIDAINSISFDMPDFLGGAHIGFNLGHVPLIPYLSTGGNIMAEGLAYLHAGERVMPAADVQRLDAGDRPGGGGGNIIFEAGAIVLQGVGPDYDAQRLAELIAPRLRDMRVVGS